MCAKRAVRSRAPLTRWVGKAAKSPWTVMVGAVASIFAVITTFTGPVVVVGAPTSTEPDALSIEPLPPNESSVMEFVLPLDAPLEEMPYSAPCTPPVIDWLDEHGVRRPRNYLMSIRNEADGGPMLTVDNVRVVDKLPVPPRPGFLFVCESQGSGETAVLNLDLDRDGPAMLVDDEDETERPFAFNLAPGEQGSIDLRLLAGADGYSGRVVADVTGGGATEQVELALSEDGGGFERPGLGKTAGFSVTVSITEGLFYCVTTNPDGTHRSTVEVDAKEVRSIVAEMWK